MFNSKEGKKIKGTVIKSDTSYTLELLLSDGETVSIPREYLADKEEIKNVEVVKMIGKEIEGIYRVINDIPILNVKELQKHYKDVVLDKETTEGDILDVKVTSVASFGVFVDIGYGVIALLPFNYVSESKAMNIEDVFREGKELKVIYKGKTPEGKYIVSHKELLGTWSENIADFEEGTIVVGLVKDITDYGIFIEIAPNLTGIADIPKNEILVGESVIVKVKRNYPEKLKLKLSILGRSYKKYRVRYNYKIKENKIVEWDYNK